MDLLKTPYEISLWDDVLTWVRLELEEADVDAESYEPGKYYCQLPGTSGIPTYELSYGNYIEGVTYYQIKEGGAKLEGTSEDISIREDDNWKDKISTILTYYKETKLCVIGSHTMESMARCVNPKLVRKVNGENTLTFNMYYRYVDIETGKEEYNPFNKYMVNERKVKLRVNEGDGAKWYDFIIKQVQENSESCAFTYTCKDQFVNELAKTGFEIVLDNELENNMGTVEQLAEYILKDSDWEVEKNDKPLKQYIEEPLYEITISAPIPNAKELESGVAKTDWINDFGDGSSIKMQRAYFFYSQINDKKSSLQFLYARDNNFSIDDDRIIDKTKHLNFIVENVVYDSSGFPDFAYQKDGERMVSLSYEYRGCRLVEQTQTKYDSTIDKYVSVYTKKSDNNNNNNEEDIYYCYEETEYLSPAATLNYIANPTDFTSTSGWRVDDNGKAPEVVTHPATWVAGQTYKSFLKYNQVGDFYLLNEGIGGNRSVIQEFVTGEEYVLRLKYKTQNITDGYASADPYVIIAEWDYEKKEGQDGFTFIKTHFEFDKWDTGRPATNEEEVDSNYVYLKGACVAPLSKTSLQNWNRRLGLFVCFYNNRGDDIFIEDMQLFPCLTFNDENGQTRLSVPGGKLFSEIKTSYIFYKPNPALKSIEDLEEKIVYSSLEDAKDFFTPSIGGAERFTKVRSVSAKESNRFNLLQELCETFECWMNIDVERDKGSGAIKLDSNYRQLKKISFKEYIGKENYAGFRYGINSKSIQRTVDSAAIVSKMIVKDNSNEHAPNGFCSIARASENPTGENFLLNFDHYIRQKLLKASVVTNDLYLEGMGYIGYYKNLKRMNKDREVKIDIQAGLLKDMAKYEADYTAHQTAVISAQDEQPLVERDIMQYTGSTGTFSEVIGALTKEDSSWRKDNKFISYWTKWCRLETVKTQSAPLAAQAESNLKEAERMYDEITLYLEDLAKKKRALNLQFYKKYSRFLQEGSWIKEDYVDSNLYYLDSESTLHTSAQPKVTYNISVIDLGPLEEYNKYEFDIGDKTFIEDVEFFGWSRIDGQVPYREEIIISEITTELDSPEKNQIKVQNYKTQFEDLFQRITATTQQAEYHTGEYSRAASIIESDGTIKAETLESSFANNEMRLKNVRDQTVEWNEYGITTRSPSNPSEVVRIISGGVFLSVDGGQSWKTGITGKGINTSYLTAGQLNVDEIYIMAESHPSFGWDSRGISAYDYKDVNGEQMAFNLNKFVRFDHHGIYGVLNAEGKKLESEEDVKNNAHFALTWNGFMLKNDNGSVQISSQDDIQVLSGTNERVKIGRLDKDGMTYGIRISKEEEKDDGSKVSVPVMITDSDGELWLENRLKIGANKSSTVELGYLSAKRKGSEIHEVIHAGRGNDDFIVYEDGKIIANYIEANGGKIGNMAIASIEKIGYEVVITSNTGITAHESEKVVLTAELYYDGKPYLSNDLAYAWYNLSEPDNTLGTEQSLEIEKISFNNNGYMQYGCRITIPEGKE